MHIESPPLTDEHTYRDVDVDQDADRVHWRSGTSRRGSGFNNDQFPSDRLSTSRQLGRSLARFCLAALIGVGATLAWQSYGAEVVRTWAPSLMPVSPASMMQPPAPAVTTADLQEQLKPLVADNVLVLHSIEQLTFNLDQLARKQDQLAQNMAILQAAEQEVSQKVSAPPQAPKVVHVPPPKSLQPLAQ